MRQKTKFNKGFLFIFCVLWILSVRSQNTTTNTPVYGLENVIVEKYYISNANDNYTDTNYQRASGFLPVGSTTYRIYLDMRPGYRFYGAYGLKKHPLKINTTTLFFNNADIGNTVPNVIPRRAYNRNTVMLDSWLSAGAAGEEYYGVLKEDDDTIGTIQHENLFLQNKNKVAGIPLSKRDGLFDMPIKNGPFMEEKKLNVPAMPFPVFFGIDDIVRRIFNNETNGGSLETNDGAWGCLGGAVGLDSLGTNRLLIAQITTDGVFSFELNVSIGKRNFPQEYYVAKDPIGGEVLIPSLIYTSKKDETEARKNKRTNQPAKEKSNKKTK